MIGSIPQLLLMVVPSGEYQFGIHDEIEDPVRHTTPGQVLIGRAAGKAFTSAHVLAGTYAYQALPRLRYWSSPARRVLAKTHNVLARWSEGHPAWKGAWYIPYDPGHFNDYVTVIGYNTEY